MTHLIRVLVFGVCLLALNAYATLDTPLHGAVEDGDKAKVELLLAKGAEVNAKDRYEETPLHRAASEAYWDIVNQLLAEGAEVNVKDRNGATPLHRAVEKGYRSVVQLLLAKGADVSAKDKYGETPRDLAERKEDKYIVELLNEQFRLQGEKRVEKTRLWKDHIKSNARAAFLELTAQLKGNPDDDTIRRLIIELAQELKPAPAIPEEARKHFVEGTAIVKAAKNPAQQALAAQSFTEALTVAPWWGDAYYNLGVAQELAEQYNEAEHAFTFYLLSNPGDQEKREAQDRIYALSAKRKLLGAK